MDYLRRYDRNLKFKKKYNTYLNYYGVTVIIIRPIK